MNRLTELQLNTILNLLSLLKPKHTVALEIDVRSPIFSNLSVTEFTISFNGVDIPVSTSYLYEDKVTFHFNSGQHFEVLL